MPIAERRYDIDWLRVIAIGLLLVYHTSISFQSWGFMLGFITNDKPFESLWIPMAMLNVWRIPLLFFISGMGVYFACQHKSWKQLLRERTKRILVPLVFGVFFIVPIQIFLSQGYYQQRLRYIPDPAHLWFLANIFIYVLLLSPIFFYIKRHFATGIKKVFSHPFGLLIVVAAFVSETLLLHPVLYELYAMTWHGFFLGLLAFFFGFCFGLSGPPFWAMLLKWRWLFLVIAATLYIGRLWQAQLKVSTIQLSIESNCWIFTVLAFGYSYLNYPGKALRYLSQAAYPIYIIHMLFLYLASLLIIPLNMDVHLKFILVLLFTVAGCFVVYELIIRRSKVIGMLFGIVR